MPDFPSPSALTTPLFIPNISKYGTSQESRIATLSTNPGARTWVANLVQYMPFTLPFPYALRRFFWQNGSTTTTTNVDMGIYSRGGQKLASTGSVAMGTASAIQYAAPTAVMLLAADMYYLAWTCDNTTSRASTLAATAVQGEMMGLLQETTGAFGLPAAMTAIAWAQAFGPQYCGITRTVSGF